MTGLIDPPVGRVAWRDRETRRALGVYALKSVAWLALSMVAALVLATLVDDNGDTKAGVPEWLPFVPGLASIFALLLGFFGLWRCAQMTWSALRQPWVLTDSQFEEMRPIELPQTPNGQPILRLAHGDDRWILTVAALMWRWSLFQDERQLLLAAPPGRSGMVATLDRRAIAWAGRSPYTAVFLWLQRRKLGSQ